MLQHDQTISGGGIFAFDKCPEGRNVADHRRLDNAVGAERRFQIYVISLPRSLGRVERVMFHCLATFCKDDERTGHVVDFMRRNPNFEVLKIS